MDVLSQGASILKDGRRNGELSSLVCHSKINTDGLGDLKQWPVYHKDQTVLIKNFITFLTLIQSHGQSRGASPANGGHNPDGRFLPTL